MNHDCTDRTKIAGEARLRLSFFLLLTACATPFLFRRINEWFLHTGLIYLIPILMITNVMFTPHLFVNLAKMNKFLLMLGLGNVHSSILVISLTIFTANICSKVHRYIEITGCKKIYWYLNTPFTKLPTALWICCH